MKLLLSVIGLALATLRENKIRSLLTVLGVVIGTGTIIAVGSILTGFDGAVTGAIRSFGTNYAIVSRFKVGPVFGGRSAEERMRKPITYENARDIEERCPSVEHVSPYVVPTGFGFIRARYKGNEVVQVNLAGTDEHYADSGNAEMRLGRFFTDNEDRHRISVAVLGGDIAKSLFGSEDPLGKIINVTGHEFEILGVMAPPPSAIPGQSDNRIILPYFTMRKMFPQIQEHILMVAAKEGKLSAAIDEFRAVLRQERHVPLDKPDNFELSTPDQIVEQFRSLTSVVALVMVVLSSIGLLVASAS